MAVVLEDKEYLEIEELLELIATSEPSGFQRYADAYKLFKKLATESYERIFVPKQRTKRQVINEWKKRKQRLKEIRMCP